MSGFGRKKTNHNARQQRRSERSKAGAVAVVQTPASTEPVTIIDISESGARLVGSPPPPSRSDVQLRVNGLSIFGSIAWRKENSFGFKFAQHLNECSSDEIHQAVEEAEVARSPFDRDEALHELVNKAADLKRSDKDRKGHNGSKTSN